MLKLIKDNSAREKYKRFVMNNHNEIKAIIEICGENHQYINLKINNYFTVDELPELLLLINEGTEELKKQP